VLHVKKNYIYLLGRITFSLSMEELCVVKLTFVQSEELPNENAPPTCVS